MQKLLSGLTIVLGCIAGAVCYGILHDQVTARICVEYFTLGHPDLFGTDSPTLLAFGWGVVATWWVGLLVGIPLSLAAQSGSRPPTTPAALVRPFVRCLLIVGGWAVLAGVVAWCGAVRGWFVLPYPWTEIIPPDRQTRFLIDLALHNTSYAAGFIGGLALCWQTWRRRSVHAAPTG